MKRKPKTHQVRAENNGVSQHEHLIKTASYQKRPCSGGNQNSDDAFFDWVISEKEFSLAYLLKHYSGLNREDAEDVFGDACEKLVKAGSARFKKLERGVFVERLKWAALDYLDRRNTQRRGKGIEHVGLSEVEGWMFASELGQDDFSLNQGELPLIRSLLSGDYLNLNKKEGLLAEIILENLGNREITYHWCEAFTGQQRRDFMTNSRGKWNDDPSAFRREVNRACRLLTEKLRRVVSRKDVLWPN